MSHFFSRIAFSGAAALLLLGATAAAATVEELLHEGDVHDQKFEAGEALKLYLAAEKLERDNVAVLLRIARQYRHLMADASAKGEKLRLGRLALGYAQRAAALAPNDAEAQLSAGITYGKMLPFMGAKEQVDASPRIKRAVDKTLRLDPRNDYAWHILGRWHRVLADIGGVKRALAGAIYGGLPKGSNEEAAKCLEKAIALNPKRLMHYIELGRVYAQMGRKEEARKIINKGLAMPNVDKDDAEAKVRGREALAKLR
jgi:tetratricopeptide (TPR) repeat protein